MMVAVVGHIKKTDGFFGLYRGLMPRLMSTYVNGLVSAAVADVSFRLFSDPEVFALKIETGESELCQRTLCLCMNERVNLFLNNNV